MKKGLITKKDIKRLLLVTIGLFIYAFALTAFLIPNKLVGGGIGGVATILYFAFNIPVGISNLLINSILLLLGMRIMGKSFGVNSFFGIVVASMWLLLLQYLITEPLVPDEPFMNALIGGALAGVGVGIAIANGGNSGGTDIIALVINKYRNIALGRVILYCDLFIIGSSFLVFWSLKDLVFGYVVMVVIAYVIDLTLNGAKQSYQFMIISKTPDIIAQRIKDEVGRGITVLDAKGWYEKKNREVLMIVARRTDRHRIIRIVKEEDPNAFTSISKVTAVFGQNFDPIRL